VLGFEVIMHQKTFRDRVRPDPLLSLQHSQTSRI